jgi:PAB-dependent poly(A)-specific ribonuclease subunit 2
VEVRPSRLGLARVSVLRGQGPAKGAACIDDYIRSAEQVHDYLTKFRWVKFKGYPWTRRMGSS